MNLEQIPAVNAFLNGCAFVLLVAAYTAIRRGRWRVHRNLMLAALGVSILFLVGYLTYHAQHGSTRFAHGGTVRVVYLAILLTHTVLAAALVPLVLTTLFHAARGRFGRHRRWARWTWPIWAYVSVTGVVIYLMLYRWYPAPV